MTIQEIIQGLNELSAECDKITTGNLSHHIANLKHSLLNTANLLEVAGVDGWHPASELPGKPTSKLGRIIIVTHDGKVNYRYYVGEWEMDNVKWWSYPPEEEE